MVEKPFPSLTVVILMIIWPAFEAWGYSAWKVNVSGWLYLLSVVLKCKPIALRMSVAT